MTEKPLHVKVAEALGCEVLYRPEWDRLNPWFCGCDSDAHCGAETAGRIGFFDTDWSDGGPLIERYGIGLSVGASNDARWGAFEDMSPDDSIYFVPGETALIAACNLILALHEAGKLPKEVTR